MKCNSERLGDGEAWRWAMETARAEGWVGGVFVGRWAVGGLGVGGLGVGLALVGALGVHEVVEDGWDSWGFFFFIVLFFFFVSHP